MTISGGKSSGATRAIEVLQSGQALLKEALTPFTDDIPADMQVLSDLVIGETLGSEQDHLSALNLKIRQRILVGPPVKLIGLGLGQSDLVGAITRHCGLLTTVHYTSIAPRKTSYNTY